MSRISQIFHNQSSRDEQGNKVSAAQNNISDTDANGLIDGVPNGVKEGDFLDNLKPKLKEIIQEIQDEEKKLCEDVDNFDTQSILSKLPILPTLAHNLPEPLKTRIKDLLARFQKPTDTTKPARTQIKINSMADITEAATKLMACASEKIPPISPLPKPSDPVPPPSAAAGETPALQA